MNDTANATVSSTPISPVAALVASGVAKAWLTAWRDWLSTPSRSARVRRISCRTRSDVSALITITSGNSDTNALAAKATDRSTNSTSNNRDRHRPRTVESSRCEARTASRRARAALPLAPASDSTVTAGCYADARKADQVPRFRREYPNICRPAGHCMHASAPVRTGGRPAVRKQPDASEC